MWSWIISIVAIAAFVMVLQSRASHRRTGEDIDEIRNSLYELRTGMKALRADWNLKLAKVQVQLLRSAKTIPEKRIPYYISKECIACGSCMPECPTNAITENSIFEIDPGLCIACAKCAEICPVSACHPIEDVPAT